MCFYRKKDCYLSLLRIIKSVLSVFQNLSKKELISIIDALRKEYVKLSDKNKAQELEILSLKSGLLKDKIKVVNKLSNKPSSKQAEWESKAGGVGNDGNKKGRGRGKKGRKGAGNKPKNKTITRIEKAYVSKCESCGKDLSNKAALCSSNTRTIEDIPESPIVTEMIEVEQEKKYCSHCKTVTTARSELALGKSDIGLNVTVHTIYLWISMCLPYTRITTYYNTIFTLKYSTSGLSKQMIRVATIMGGVYKEILEDIRTSKILHADETGWRVEGKNWWLWVFGNYDSAFYSIDKSRGGDVVRRILGDTFAGVLVVDGWGAYVSIICEQQSCMAHLLRKIRKFHAAFPRLRSVCDFYLRFRKILKDGEGLQSKRKELEEGVFKRRLKKLHDRLDNLIQSKNPNEILGEIIKKVKKQRPRILTFVEHPYVPCHNNYGEYLIRIGVLKRKVSYGSKSAQGAQAYAVLLSIYTTCKLRKISFFEFMKVSLKHYIKTGRPMLLKEYQSLKLQIKKTA